MVAQLVLRFGIALRCGLAPPLQRQVIPALHPVAASVHLAKHGLRFGIALDGGLLAPLRGERVVLRHAAAVGIHDAQIELRACFALLGSTAQPRYCERVVFFPTLRIRVHEAQAILGLGMASFGQGAPLFPRIAVVAGAVVRITLLESIVLAVLRPNNHRCAAQCQEQHRGPKARRAARRSLPPAEPASHVGD
nr:hypothetical protein [Achromobacter piechaudii]